MQFHLKTFWFIWFHVFFCLDFLNFSGPLCIIQNCNRGYYLNCSRGYYLHWEQLWTTFPELRIERNMPQQTNSYPNGLVWHRGGLFLLPLVLDYHIFPKVKWLLFYTLKWWEKLICDSDLRSFVTSETSKKIRKSTFQVKISE